MNWKLIALLSLTGLFMGLGAVFVLPWNVEPMLWGPIMLGTAVAIARFAPGRYFLHGLATSLANCVWITGAEVVFTTTYLARHPEEVAMLASISASPRIAMLLTGPLYGIGFGIVFGLLAFAASKIIKRGKSAETTPRAATA